MVNILKKLGKCYTSWALARACIPWYNRNIKLLHIFMAAGEERETHYENEEAVIRIISLCCNDWRNDWLRWRQEKRRKEGCWRHH